MSRPSSPALRPLQITTDGNTLVGRSPHSKLIERQSPAVKRNLVKENAKSARKITLKSSFPTEPNEEKPIIAKTPATRVDTGINTELELAPDFKNEKNVREKLYNTGPKLFDAETESWKPFWETRAKEIRQRLNEALLEKLACDDEIENLLEENRKLQEELEEYKEYFELREYSNRVLGDDDE